MGEMDMNHAWLIKANITLHRCPFVYYESLLPAIPLHFVSHIAHNSTSNETVHFPSNDVEFRQDEWIYIYIVYDINLTITNTLGKFDP